MSTGVQNIYYFNRRDGHLNREKVYAEPFLNWCANNTLGNRVTMLLLRRRWLSYLYGLWQQTSWSKCKIKPFIAQLEIEQEGWLIPVEGYRTFSEFFTRKIDPATRPIVAGPGNCICPADGKVLILPTVPAEDHFIIKTHVFNLSSFLNDPDLAEQYNDGTMVICRLHLRDCHHFHFPAEGIPEKPRLINGSFYPGGPYSRQNKLPFYAANHRMITRIRTSSFGVVLMIEIGALTVGSIIQQYRPNCFVARGTHKGYFAPGGSTVVLVFQKNAFIPDADLIAHSAMGIETFMRMGEPIGTTKECII